MSGKRTENTCNKVEINRVNWADQFKEKGLIVIRVDPYISPATIALVHGLVYKDVRGFSGANSVSCRLTAIRNDTGEMTRYLGVGARMLAKRDPATYSLALVAAPRHREELDA